MTDYPHHPKTALFPGTFDPITSGHLDIIRRACPLFDRLIVAVARNPAKKSIFPSVERVAIIEELVSDLPNVEVDRFEGLTIDYAKSIKANAIVRGLRNVTDLNFEFQLALTNRALTSIETVFIMTGEHYAFTSSTLIKQIAAGGEIDRLHQLLPHIVIEKLKQKKRENGGNLPWAHVDHFKE
ncbi:pantetheine-phosphate adenylyltransferase [Mucisphaera calidilacus]|uniref:Phosphopantetheine adenylyltransferase n=1 Tax=Mucisphaera calidilacus TaxID=2527982 RepID=A0A518BVD0_9BACT|nr:pantetheine-phosphate adenylyltransferase [Mucisphaera calidilacus]QDU70894.1 Phosphopantetheine adenylyltransferase [Mucisphaera calidilacus]